MDEATKLSDALSVHLKPLSGQAERHALLREYLDAGTDKLALLMRIEHRPARFWHRTWVMPVKCSDCARVLDAERRLASTTRAWCACMQADRPTYHQLMANHTLRLALAQKTVIEFPVILVILQRQLPRYTVLKPGQA